jgi:hypothetical protein
MAGAAAAQPTRAPLDGSIVIAGVEVGCTGIGQTKNDPKWLAYPVRLEFADPSHAYLANERVILIAPGGERLFEVACEGPWILMKLPPGRPYKVIAEVPGAPPQTAVIRAPAHGQQRVVLTFATDNSPP